MDTGTGDLADDIKKHQKNSADRNAALLLLMKVVETDMPWEIYCRVRAYLLV